MHRIFKAPIAADGTVMSVKLQGLDQAQHEAMGLVLPFKGYKQGTRSNLNPQTPNPKPQTTNPKPQTLKPDAGKYTSTSCVPTDIETAIIKQRLQVARHTSRAARHTSHVTRHLQRPIVTVKSSYEQSKSSGFPLSSGEAEVC